MTKRSKNAIGSCIFWGVLEGVYLVAGYFLGKQAGLALGEAIMAFDEEKKATERDIEWSRNAILNGCKDPEEWDYLAD